MPCRHRSLMYASNCVKIRNMNLCTLYVCCGSKLLYFSGAKVYTNDSTPLKENFYGHILLTWHFLHVETSCEIWQIFVRAKIFHSTVVLYTFSLVRWQPEFQCTVQFDVVPHYNAYHSSEMVYFCMLHLAHCSSNQCTGTPPRYYS